MAIYTRTCRTKQCFGFTIMVAVLGLVVTSLYGFVELTHNTVKMVHRIAPSDDFMQNPVSPSEEKKTSINSWLKTVLSQEETVPKKDLQHHYNGISARLGVEAITWNTSLQYSADQLPPPPKYHPKFRSPCWYESPSLQESHVLNNGYIPIWMPNFAARIRAQISTSNATAKKPKKTVLQCLPSFYLIGINKAGTTDLNYWFKRHPQMSGSILKEPQWWNVNRFGYEVGYEDVLPPIPFRDYVALFYTAAKEVRHHPQNVVYEASARTFWNNDMWPLYIGNDMNALEPEVTIANHIKSMHPATKIALVLRNPTSRLYSQYMFLYLDRKNKSPEHFHGQVVNAVSKMKECIAEFGDRACAYSLKLNQPLETYHVFLRAGMYSIYLKDWLDVFGREQMFIFRFEDYVVNRKKTLNEIFNFLKLDPMPSKFDDVLLGETHKNNRTKAYSRTGTMLPETSEILDNFYKPYKQGVAELLNNDAYLWQ